MVSGLGSTVSPSRLGQGGFTINSDQLLRAGVSHGEAGLMDGVVSVCGPPRNPNNMMYHVPTYP